MEGNKQNEKKNPAKSPIKNNNKKEENPKIKRKCYYGSLIINLALVQAYFGINDTLVSPIFSKVKEDLNWTEKNSNMLLSISQSIPILAFIISAYTNPLFVNIKPNTLISITKAVYILSITLMLFNNTITFIIGRFLSGFALGYQLPVCFSTIYDGTHANHRGRIGIIPNIMYSFGFVLSIFLGSLVSQNSISRITFYLIIIGFATFDVLFFNFVLKMDKSPFYFLMKNDKNKAEKVLEFYMTEEGKNDMMEMLIAAKRLSNKAQEESKGSFWKKYKPEIKFSVIYSIAIQLSCFSPVAVYAIFMITKDMEDDEEVSKSGRYLTIASFLDMLAQVVLMTFNINKKRKVGFLISGSFLILIYSLQGILILGEKWEMVKASIILVYIGIAYFTSCYYAQLSEYFPQSIVGIAHSNSLIIWFLTGVIFPILDLKRDNNRILHFGSFGFALFQFFSCLLILFFVFETDGLSREDVYWRLRGGRKKKLYRVGSEGDERKVVGERESFKN